MTYTIIEESTELLRSFELTCGLGPFATDKVRAEEEVLAIVTSWMAIRIRSREPIIKVEISLVNEVYAWEEDGEIISPTKFRIKFQGRVGRPLNPHLNEAGDIEMINSLASFVGKKLKQSEVRVSYRDKTWLLEECPEEDPEHS